MSDILKEEKPRVMKLADGNEYTFPPFNLTSLANVEDTMGFPFSKLPEKIEELGAIKAMRLVVHGLLKENYTDMSLEDAGGLITLGQLKEITEYINSALGE